MVGSRHRGNEDYANYLDCQHDWIDKHLERSVKHDSGWGVSVVSSEGEVGRKHPPCVWKATTDRQSPVESMGRTLRKPVSKWVLDLYALPGCCDVKFRIPPLSPHHHGLRPLKVRANIKPSFLCLSFATAVKNKTDLTMTSTGRNWKSEPRRKSFCLWRWTAPAVRTPFCLHREPWLQASIPSLLKMEPQGRLLVQCLGWGFSFLRWSLRFSSHCFTFPCCRENTTGAYTNHMAAGAPRLCFTCQQTVGSFHTFPHHLVTVSLFLLKACFTLGRSKCNKKAQVF